MSHTARQSRMMSQRRPYFTYQTDRSPIPEHLLAVTPCSGISSVRRIPSGITLARKFPSKQSGDQMNCRLAGAETFPMSREERR